MIRRWLRSDGGPGDRDAKGRDTKGRDAKGRDAKARAEGWDVEQALAGQRECLAALGLDYDAARARLDRTLAELGRAPYDEADGAASEHWVAFAALAQRLPARRILEIGTYDGETARLLAALFPDARVTTVDLPHDDPRFAKLYEREEPAVRARFVERQLANTRDPRIELLLVDSFLLPERVAPGFDLVWVDGAHRYPSVAWDLGNAYHLATQEGWILCDDVLRHPEARGFHWVNGDSHQAIEALGELGVVEVSYLLKRVGARWSADPVRRKHVAILRRRGSERAGGAPA